MKTRRNLRWMRVRALTDLALVCTLALCALNVRAQTLPSLTLTAGSTLSNPFATSPKPELPPPPLITKLPSVPLPMALPPPVAPLPTDLRTLLISENGTGLLGTSEMGAASILVTHGQTLRVGEQEVYAEVGRNSIRLYTATRGKLLWEGGLKGPGLINPPIDMTQLKYIPPLSAGVSPGLGQTRSTAAEPLITRTEGQ